MWSSRPASSCSGGCNDAPDATLALVRMRADLRRLMRDHPELRPVDHDFHHLLTSWFNRGFLRMAEITWDSPKELHDYLVRYEKVHPMAGPRPHSAGACSPRTAVSMPSFTRPPAMCR